MRDSWGEGYLYFIFLKVAPFQVHNIKLLEGQRVFGVIDVPDELEYLELVIGIFNRVIVLELFPSN